jgi:hypothetical protein
MIIVKLAGGLGNQMFQYACGRALSSKHNAPLFLDHSFLEDKSFKEDFTYREYELNAFNIDKRIEKSDLKRIGLSDAFNKPYETVFSLRRLLSGYQYFSQKGHGIDERISKIGSKVYLVGYYQSDYYFKDYENVIRDDFKFIPTAKEENKLLINKITSSENPIALHVRRGDFLTLGGGKVHGTCSLDYYKNAIAIVKEKVTNPTFFIFSVDDPEWAAKNLKIDAPFEVIGNDNIGQHGFENMRLMSMCKHNIIANSSFSWWGAWLNNNPQKIVIAPKQWFDDDSRNSQMNKITPDSWYRI